MLTNAELALISLLAETPRHGYGIEQAIEHRGMRQWTEIGFSSIYFLLKKLDARGLIEPLEKTTLSRRTPKTYRLTPAGEEAYRDAVHHALLEPGRAITNFPLGLANWPALPADVALLALQTRHKSLQSELARLWLQKDSQAPLPDFVEALFDYSQSMIAAESAWLEKTINKLSEDTMQKIDLKKEYRDFYSAPIGDFILLDLPKFSYLMVDGFGNPNTEPSHRQAIEALYTTSYTLKFMSKADYGQDYVVPPLEGLWWAQNPEDFVTRKKDRWSWTMMIMVPDFIEPERVEMAIQKARLKKENPALDLIRFQDLDEGRVVQTLHIGTYDDEGPILKKMHEAFMPAKGLDFSGVHHEIYLSDPRKTAPEKLKTLLRQPVKPKG